MFEKNRTNAEYAALVDIGSGSITASIIYTNHKHDHVEVIWTHQERLLLKHVEADRGVKPLLSTLLQVMLTLGNEGLQALRSFDTHAKITTMQVGVSAPWSYTVTKTVTLKHDDPFTIDKKILESIRETAEEKIQTEINENELARSLELSVVARSVTELRANDYKIKDLSNQTVQSLTLKLSSIIIQDYLHKAIVEVRDKVLPNATIQIVSAMMQVYFTLRDIHYEMQEYCIVNVTLEATEIGIVREGVLTYSTHEPYGVLHLARDISKTTNVPLAEVYGQLQSKDFAKEVQKTAALEEAVNEILTEYKQRIANLLSETGDNFTTPKSLYLHCTGCAQDYLVKHIEEAAERATGLSHIVHIIRDDLSTVVQNTSSESCIEMMSGHFFHRYGHDSRFTFL